jgi:hypothetical protein
MSVLNIYVEVPKLPDHTPLRNHGIPVDKIEPYDKVAVAVWVSFDQLTELKRQLEITLEQYKHLSNK